MNTELRMRVVPDLRFLAGADGTPDRIQAKALVYGAVSEDMGGWREVFAPESVELDPDLRMLFDHQTSMVIGRQSAGTLDAMDDGSGIVATGYPPDTSWARDLRTSMERGDIDQMSFRFLALEDDIAWVPSEAAPDGGYVLRTVLRARVSELSVVAIPAYPQTVALARASVTGELRRRVWAALPSELREGKVLSADNLAALIQIHDLTETVLNGADPELGRRQPGLRRDFRRGRTRRGRRWRSVRTPAGRRGGRRVAGRSVRRRSGARKRPRGGARGRVHDCEGSWPEWLTTVSWSARPARSGPATRRCWPRAPK